MFDELLRIKRRREDNAVAAVAEAKRAAESAAAAKREQERKLEDFDSWAAAERGRLDDKILGRAVTRSALDRYREDIGVLRERRLRLEEALAAAEAAAKDARAAVEVARQRRIEANREVVKFEEYGKALAAEERRAEQIREDTEAEEVASAARGPRQG